MKMVIFVLPFISLETFSLLKQILHWLFVFDRFSYFIKLLNFDMKRMLKVLFVNVRLEMQRYLTHLFFELNKINIEFLIVLLLLLLLLLLLHRKKMLSPSNTKWNQRMKWRI
jgi:hypothetical protein